MRRTGALTLVVALAIAFVACGEVPVEPDRPTVDMVGPLAGIEEGEDRVMYTLEDGRQWARARDQFEVVYDLPSGPTLFVALSNPAGVYVLLVGGQDGLAGRLLLCASVRRPRLGRLDRGLRLPQAA